MTDKDKVESLDDLLLQYVKIGKLSIVKELIHKGANINSRDNGTCSDIPRNKKIDKILLQSGADQSPLDSSCYTPLDYAIHNGCKCDNYEIADLLLENGAIISAPAFIDKVMRYIGAKMDIDEDPSQNCHWRKEVQKFIEYGAKIKWTKSNMWPNGSPLHVLAELMDCEDLILEMVQKGIDINIQEQDNRTPLLRAAQFNQIANVRVLLENGANPNIPSKYSFEGNPFHEAIKRKHNEIALLMMKHGADIYSPCSDLFGNEHPPLHLAILHQNQGMVKALIKHGCDIESKGIDDFTSLHIAAQKGFEDILETLLETRGANVNVQLLDGTFETPLHLATEAREKKCVKILLEHEASDFLRDHLGCTPFEVALSPHNGDIYKTFLYHNHLKI